MKQLTRLHDLNDDHMAQHPGAQNALDYFAELGAETLIDILEGREGKKVTFVSEPRAEGVPGSVVTWSYG